MNSPEALLKSLLTRLLDVPSEQLNDESDLICHGLDSMLTMRVASELRRAGISVRFTELIGKRTLAEWIAIVRAANNITVPPAIHVNADEAPFELAAMQHAFWIGRQEQQQLGGVSAHFYAEFDGAELEPECLNQAFKQLIARHPMLRMRINSEGLQHTVTVSDCQLQVNDLIDLSATEVKLQLEKYRQRYTHQRLDIEQGQTIMLALTRLPGQRSRLHLDLDMIAGDAASLRILLRELASLYARPDESLPEINFSYQSYLRQKRENQQSQWQEDRRWWQQQLADLAGPPALPLRTTSAVPRTERKHFCLNEAQSQTLSQLSQQAGLTVPVVLATLFSETVGLWSGAAPFVLNLPVFSRHSDHPQVDLLVGDFSSSVLVTIEPASQPDFIAQARGFQGKLHQAMAHSTYGGVEVLRDLARQQNGEQVLAPVVFTSALALGELYEPQVRQTLGDPVWSISQGPQVWLDAQATEFQGGILLNWDFRADLFLPQAIDAMFDWFRQRTLALLDDPVSWRKPLATPVPLVSFPQPEAPVASGIPLHQRFFHQAQRRPRAIALMWGDKQQLTYDELAHQALCVAGYLQQQGVKTGDYVAVSMGKGIGQVIAVLGILAAGAAYVPCGIDVPLQRRRQVYQTADVRWVLSDDRPDCRPSWPEEVAVVPLSVALASPPLPSCLPVSPQQAMYAIFTSGSTGTPKGVAVSHGAVANTIDAVDGLFLFTPADRTISLSELDFDLSAYDIFASLSRGAGLVVVDEFQRRDAHAWVALLQRWQVTIVSCVPALLDMILTAAADNPLPSLRLVMMGGDRIPAEMASRWWSLTGQAAFVGLGGMTEAAIHSTVFVLQPDDTRWSAVPFGQPLANMHCRIVDDRGRDCPAWVGGELWVSGPGLALGYLKDPVRSAEKFVEDAGRRWYRSGDRVRYWPEGIIEYIGRTDQQIKIRGHRIELGEIETALLSHPLVLQASVGIVSSAARQLCASLVTLQPLSHATLRNWLQAQLPAYAVPEHYQFLVEMPLTANGKLDRRALQQQAERQLASAERQFLPPEGEIEQRVAALWQQLLQVAQVGREDNFFVLGGDSLIATRLIARMHEQSLTAPLAELFATPTLAAFCGHVRRQHQVPDQPLSADEANRYQPFPLSDIQRAFWIGRSGEMTLGAVGSHFYIEFDGQGLDVVRLEQAWRQLMLRHDMLRVRVTEAGQQQVAEQLPAWKIEQHWLNEDAQAELATLRETLSHQVYDPCRWPLFAIHVAHYAQRQRLFVSLDSMMLDGRSIMVLFTEWDRLYCDPCSSLPELAIRYRDYVVQNRPAAERERQAQAWWQQHLSTLPERPALPLAVAPETLKKPRFRRWSHELSPDRWQQFKAMAKSYGITPSVVLAAAYGEVLARWSNQSALAINLTMFDRQPRHPQINHVVGDFASILLLGYQSSAGGDFLAAARRLQQQEGAALAQRGASGIWVLRELARQKGQTMASMPVVFTSVIGLDKDASLDLSDAFPQQIYAITQTPQVWLDAKISESRGRLLLEWDALEALFPAGMIEAMFSGYCQLVAQLTQSDWRQPVALPLPESQQQVRRLINQTAFTFPDSRPLYLRFFAEARQRPDADALIWGREGRMDYGTLAQQALAVAGYLQQQGIQPGDRVAITHAKGPRQIVAVLGVLAAGGCYVPSGIGLPQARRAVVYRDAGVKRVLCDENSLHQLSWPQGVAVTSLSEALRATPLDAPLVQPADAAKYIIFTSGSTGTPKGVVVSHGAVANTVDAVAARFGISDSDRSITLSALDFDLSAYDIFTFLGRGASLVVVDEAERRDAAAWVELINRWQVSVISAVPALIEMITVAAQAHGLTHALRLVMVGGDRVVRQLPQDLWQLSPQTRFVSLGGMTEAAIHSTYYEIQPDDPWWASAPYGVPLANMQCRVVDQQGGDCPDWVKGELWVSGAGVATGYHGDEQRSAEKFVAWQQRRWYRTGDVASYRPSGVLEFFGRADNQVKIRGHRIELGEVEGAISRLPQVESAVAVVLTGTTRQLAAALVASRPIDLAAVKYAARASLPDYEVPEHLIQISQIPLTANGKVDREAISRQIAERLEQAAHAGEPQPISGEAETLLAQLWRELLAVPQVAASDNFFSLGGDSLVATRLMSRLQQAGFRGALSSLFSTPELRPFAASLKREATAQQPVLTHDATCRYQPFPLTDVQQAYWLGRQEAFTLGDIAAQCYNEYELPGMDVARMEQAWHQLVLRHDMLRCRITADGQQQIMQEVPFYHFRQHHPGAASLDELRRQMARQKLAPDSGRLYDVQVIHYGDRQLRLAVLLDNLIVDGLSMLTLFTELFHYYQHPEQPLPPLGVGFRDYQCLRQQQGTASESRQYWQQRLASLPAAPALPTQVEPETLAQPLFHRLQARLATPQWQKILQRARQAQITPSVLLLTCFSETLSRWSGQRSLVVNMTLFDRKPLHPDINRVIGDFTSLILAEYHARADESWLSHAQRMQAQIWRDLDHQEVSAVSVMRQLAQHHGWETRAVPVVFTSMLGVADALAKAAPWPDFTLSQTPQVWLDHQVIDLEDGLLLSWDYLEDLFPPQMVEQMFASYCTALQRLADDDWQLPPPRQLPLAQRSVRQRINATDAPQQGPVLLHHGFFEQASLHPQRIALRDGQSGAISYGELRESALAVAAGLQLQGVNEGDCVAIGLPRGVEQIAAVLGVLAAGAAYLPVNGKHPPARQALLCRKAQAKRAIGCVNGAISLPLQQLLNCAPLPEPVLPDAASLAYIIFTSGSTGEPKGVEVEHRSASNTVDDICQRYAICSQDVFLGVAALDFDLSVFDIFGALSQGAQLVLSAEEEHRDAEGWLALMQQHRVSVWNSVPTLMEMTLEIAQLRGDELPDLRLALLSGDWVSPDIAARLEPIAPQCRTIALGGATEAAIWSNAWAIPARPPRDWTSVPYGLPLRNQRFRVVDELGCDLPDWVAGELWIGGMGVARGYCGDRHLTQASFSGDYPQRWYRTGDMGRYRPDGVLEFLGRRDGQVKLRGHRIELGEIEQQLQRCPGVRRAVVLLKGSGVSASLHAFYEGEAAIDAVQRGLRSVLPGWAIPGAIASLSRWPLTANGKIDRKALAQLSAQTAETALSLDDPHQQALADIWQQVLGAHPSHAGESFFSAGGNSLLGTRLVAQICKHFSIRLTLRDFFADATLSGLCASVERHLADKNSMEEGLL
ncbi:amino acid adenylation domain-containing protein [Salmonella enterica subsp. enterica serovar Newport]|nr:amino acid adenylation domain-containing protein [Salmonella enterica subsp. enterica serovar Newport]EEH3936244.1 amino acid adenylation domain-containing protein [Salmonella enterica subsp. enterica serovar Newport]